MSDKKKNIGIQDDSKVDIRDHSEVEYLHRQFPYNTHKQIKAAIEKKGPLREDIVEYLKTH